MNYSYPWLEKSYDNANNGMLYGIHINNKTLDSDPAYFPQFLLINERFPQLAGEAEANLNRTEFEKSYQYLTHPFGLVWYNPDWRNYTNHTYTNQDLCVIENARWEV
jgi:hypothetical protein